ncbi:ATPase [Marmoricola endophyticus]|uniref:histidine kinase n=1 Tax=Marmoricola endophyticus TaxID=2040280 RepID=A0A917BUS1_9ACTN|nr:ATP-binding protein [Marmoricola endophyticus]GGF57474.1 ATPase [Marmoricola endophyticus]
MWSLGRRRTARHEPSLAAQILLLQLAVVAVVLAIVAAISLHQSTTRFAADRGSRMSSVAEYVANLSVVRSQLARARTDDVVADGLRRTLAPSADRALNLSGAGEVMIAAPDGTVLVSSDPGLEGSPLRLGESRVREGRGWTGTVSTPDGPVVAGHAPVLADDGSLVGLVAAEQSYPSVWDRVSDAASDLLLFLGLGALLGGVGTWVVSRVLKRRSQGLGPREIAMLADHREALLHSIREGVVALDGDRRVTTLNDAARETLQIAGDPLGRRVDELGLDPRVVDLLVGAEEVRDAVAVVGDRVVVLNRRTPSAGGRGVGTVTTLRDRTELVALQGQLSSNLSITDTLRAQTHEFSNQLHTISGLLQLGEYDELGALVGALTRRRAAITDQVTERVRDPGVAALLVAKWSASAERGVRLRLHEDSALPRLSPGTAADLTTVLGNLVDNAVDASVGRAHAEGRPLVEVELGAEGGRLRCVVRDDGPGVPEDLREAIFVRGFSTKPEVLGGRGIGLPLVQMICTRAGGTVSVARGVRGGAEFTVLLPVVAEVPV